jgi:DNA-binding PadR family transcriptional regulator
MTRVLSEEGLLRAEVDPGGGNRHQLTLTAAGEQLVKRWGGELEKRFAVVVEDADVPYGTYAEYTRRLLEQLDGPHPTSRRRGRP